MSAQRIHMVGIGGIGMSGLAQLLVSRGAIVSGSDRSESPTTALLRDRGVVVSIGHDGSLLSDGVELLIYSDAVWEDNPERMHAALHHIPQQSYFEALGDVSRSMRTVAVAGTHGKTTTTGMLAKILHDTGVNPTAIVGSIVRDFALSAEGHDGEVSGGSNFLHGRDDLFVVEACEYRDHLLKLSPEILVITNIELDHTDFFPDLASILKTFRAAVERVPATGVIVTNPNDPHIAAVLDGAQARIVDYTQKAVGTLLLPGEFNRENARAALAAALAVAPDISQEAAVHALSQFRGSWRRFEFKGETSMGALVYDDYAHHPTAVQKTLDAAREMFPDKKIVIAFHPHLYSRTASFLEPFARVLAQADETLIAPIFAAREIDDGSISSEILAERAREFGGNVLALGSFDAIRDSLSAHGPDTVIFTIGAGDIYKVAEEITHE